MDVSKILTELRDERQQIEESDFEPRTTGPWTRQASRPPAILDGLRCRCSQTPWPSAWQQEQGGRRWCRGRSRRLQRKAPPDPLHRK